MAKYKSEIMFMCGCVVGLALGYVLFSNPVKGKVPVEVRSTIVGQPSAKFVELGPMESGNVGDLPNLMLARDKICSLLVNVGERVDVVITGYQSYLSFSGVLTDADGYMHMLSGKRPRR